MDKNLGFITGFIFGLFGFIVPSIAFSRILDALIVFFLPLPRLVLLIFNITEVTAENPLNTFVIILYFGSFLINALLFGLIGFSIQKYLRAKNKNENIVVYLFITIVVLFVLIGILECSIVPNCGA